MLTISGGQLWNQWFALKAGACKTIEFNKHSYIQVSLMYDELKYDRCVLSIKFLGVICFL